MSRSNWLWPLLLIGVAIVLIANAFGAIPANVLDLISRGWPILLVLFGLTALIGRRIRFANVIILAVCILLTGGLIVVAYGKQASRVLDDYKTTIAQAVPGDVNSVRVNITTLLAGLDITVGTDKSVSGTFSGSSESKLTTAYSSDQGIGTVTITETRLNSLPSLSSIGRGKLTLTLPAGILLDDLTIKGGDGELKLDLSGASVRNLNLRIANGGILLTLPSLPPQSALGGSVKTENGDLSVTVPSGLTLKLSIENGRPTFDQANYLLLSGGVLQTSGVRDFQAALTVGASGVVSIKP